MQSLCDSPPTAQCLTICFRAVASSLALRLSTGTSAGAPWLKLLGEPRPWLILCVPLGRTDYSAFCCSAAGTFTSLSRRVSVLAGATGPRSLLSPLLLDGRHMYVAEPALSRLLLSCRHAYLAEPVLSRLLFGGRRVYSAEPVCLSVFVGASGSYCLLSRLLFGGRPVYAAEPVLSRLLFGGRHVYVAEPARPG